MVGAVKATQFKVRSGTEHRTSHGEPVARVIVLQLR